MKKEDISTKELVIVSVMMALALVLYMVDKSITLPFKWVSTLIYFLPVITIAIFMRKSLFFCGIIVLSVAMFITGTGARTLLDFIFEYVVPLLSISSFFIVGDYNSYKSIFRVYIALITTLFVTFSMYVLAGVIVYGVTLPASIYMNATNVILPSVILSILVVPTLEIMNKLIK